MCRECEHVGVMPVYKPLSLFLLTLEMDQNSVERASGNGEILANAVDKVATWHKPNLLRRIAFLIGAYKPFASSYAEP